MATSSDYRALYKAYSLIEQSSLFQGSTGRAHQLKTHCKPQSGTGLHSTQPEGLRSWHELGHRKDAPRSGQFDQCGRTGERGPEYQYSARDIKGQPRPRRQNSAIHSELPIQRILSHLTDIWRVLYKGAETRSKILLMILSNPTITSSHYLIQSR